MRTVALTFDDGPDIWTLKVLQVLHDERVHASFFVIGNKASARPAIIHRIVKEGHLVGNHTWSHHTPSTRVGWSTGKLRVELARTSGRVQKVTSRPLCLFRPPGGVVKGARRVSRAAGLSIVLWSVDTRDWSTRRESDATLVRKRASRGLHQRNPVILLHDGGGNRAATVAALPGIISDYRSHGYRFVTLDGAH
jgi:peptidoglycan/xylan/chitin deacetylase (PgdA/CDA1 family)